MRTDPATAELAAHIRYASACAHLDRLQSLIAGTGPGTVSVAVRRAALQMPDDERAQALLVAVYAIAEHGWNAGQATRCAGLERLLGMARVALDCPDPPRREAMLRVLGWQPYRLPATVQAVALTTAALILAEHGAAGLDYLSCAASHG